MPVYLIRETLDTSESREMQLNRKYRDLVRETVQSLALRLPGDNLEETMTSNNTFNLVSGDYIGMNVENDHSHVKGLTADSKFTSQLGLNNSAIVEGILFNSSGDNQGSLALVGIGRTCVFRNCVFEKTEEATSYHIELAATTSKMLAIGCVFRGPAKSTPILLNPGIAANAVFVGCFDQTANGYGTSTQVGCL